MAQLASNRDDTVCIAVLRAGQNSFLVVAEKGNFLCTGPWHCDGWVNDYLQYYYFVRLVYMDLFDERFFNSSGFLVLIWGSGVVLCTTIIWAGIVAGWMPVIGGYFVARFCCLRSPLSRAWGASSVG